MPGLDQISPEIARLIKKLSPEMFRIIFPEGETPGNLSAKYSPGQILTGKVLNIASDGKAAIQLDGKNFQARFNGAGQVVNGQTLRVVVEQISPTPVLRLVAPQSQPSSVADQATVQDQVAVTRASRNRHPQINRLNPSDLQALKISPGREFQAPISRIIDGNTLAVTINNQTRLVSGVTTSALTPGETITLQVRQDSGSYLLVPQPGKETIPLHLMNSLKSYLAARQPFGDMVRQVEQGILNNPLLKELKIDPALIAGLKATIKFLSASGKQGLTGDVLREQVNQSGINYESKVRKLLLENPVPGAREILSKDLKGQLLRLQQSLEKFAGADIAKTPAPGSRSVAEIAQQVRYAVDNIELQQISNHFSREEFQTTLLQLPTPLSAGGKTLKVFIKKGDRDSQKRQANQQVMHLVFLLELSALGPLRVDTKLNHGELIVKFGAEKQEVVDFIGLNVNAIKSKLEDLGFQAQVDCCLRKKEELQEEDGLTQLLINSDTRLVDIKT